MNENAIKNYAAWARRELIAEVERRCAMYGITASKDCPLDVDSVEGRVLTSLERKQRRELVIMARNGMDALVERAAYTWFNRILAIRFMECNDRLPSQTRMFSAVDGSFSPQVLKEALSVEIGGIDRSRVASLLQTGNDEALFRYLFLLQCDELAECMPAVFAKLGKDPLTLLLPDGLLRSDGVIGRIITDIDERDWLDSVQIVGWMYQYYMADVRAELQDVKVGRRQIGTATQVYTSEWMVRHMVENSIGRLWVLNHADSPLRERMEFFVDSGETRFFHVDSPEDITVMDPACGSGHILVYAFDLLARIYAEAGYSTRDAARLIVSRNLFGLEIDERATALASFSITMKACEIDPRFLRRGVLPNIKTLDSIEFEDDELELCRRLAKSHRLLDSLAHLDICGSLFVPTHNEIEMLESELEIAKAEQSLFAISAVAKIEKALDLLACLSAKWAVAIANPPYRSSAKMDRWMSSWLREEYREEKADLFAAFIWRLANSRVTGGVMSIAASNSWMFISTFEAARRKILEQLDIATLVQLSVHGYKGIAAQVFLFSCVDKQDENYLGGFIRLNNFDHHRLQEPKTIEAIANQDCGWFYRANTEDFKAIPGWPIAYWANEAIIHAFKTGTPLLEVSKPRQGLATADNNRFLRLWWEVSFNKIGIDCDSRTAARKSEKRWFPCDKGGDFRKWYGNNEFVVNWENDGEEIQNFRDDTGKQRSRPQNLDFYFLPYTGWSNVSSGSIAFRHKPAGTIIEHCSDGLYGDESTRMDLLAFMNSSIASEFLSILSPTLHYEVGQIAKCPIIAPNDDALVRSIASDNIGYAKLDYDAFETSCDFRVHPLVSWSYELWDATSIGATMYHFYGSHPQTNSSLELCYMLWQGQCRERFDRLKSNEEELNGIFAHIYGMEGEAPIAVPDDKVSVRLADKARDIKSLIGYAVGCMLGRYSLDAEGLVLANQGDGLAEYLKKVPKPTFMPDDDGIIPITDTEYFHDDATGFFIDFMRTVYGEESLEDNLAFVADALGGSGTPREAIRNYFMNGFFADHCKIYQKKPIYWLFDSGKKGGFRAIVYMHRYKPDLLAKLRTDYVHEQQDRYRTQIEHIDDALDTADRRQQAELKKRRKKLSEQLAEIGVFEEKIHHLADQMIEIDLDDGVSANYAKFQEVLAKIK